MTTESVGTAIIGTILSKASSEFNGDVLRLGRRRATRILVTGGAGFIGSHVVEQLLARKAGELHVLDDLSRGRREWVSRDVSFHQVDLREADSVRRTVAEVHAEAVLHLAALHFIPAVEEAPELARRVNVEGTKNLLEALSLARPKVLLFASTAAVYADTPGPIPETSPVAPSDVYGETKATGERLVAEFGTQTGTHSVIARLFNVIGERETNPHVVPELVRQLRAGVSSVRLGNLHKRRDYTDAVDVADALVRLLDPDPVRTVFNVGSGRGISVSELVSTCEKILGREIVIDVDGARVRKQDRNELIADVKLLRDATGWEPNRSLEQTLGRLLREA
jgi:UDP-glucose 4-epimerase